MLLLSIIDTPSLAGNFITGFIALFMVLIVWRARKYPHVLSNSLIFFSLLLCLAHYLFPLAGTDFYGYKETVETAGYTNINSISQYYHHMEKPYYFIINIVNNNYLLFRLVVWGGSLLLFWLTAKRLELDKSTFAFYLCICIAQLTSTSRGCLAMALAFYGFSFVIKPTIGAGRNVLSIITGLLIIYVSVYFHRSAIFLLAILPLSLLTLNRRTFWLYSLIIIVITIVINSNLFDFISNFEQDETSLFDAQTAMFYLDTDRDRMFGFGQIIEKTFKYGSHIVLSIMIIKSIVNDSYMSWPKQIQKFANATLLINVLAALILLAPGMTTYKTFERIIDFSYVPQSFMLAYLLKVDYEKKLVNLISLLVAGYVVYGIIYYDFYFGINNFR